MNRPISIDIVSDVVCPWCYIGQARLRKALALLPHRAFQVAWRPFQLNPDLPAGGVDREEYLRQRFGARMPELAAQVEQAARAEGLPIDFSRQARLPNTLQAHRLLATAHAQGRGDDLAQRLFRAYFAEGGDVEGKEALAAFGREAGLDEASIARFLQSDEGLDEVRYEEYQYRRAGIAAVPSFIINQRYLVQGAQPPQPLAEAIEQAANS
jgi:predicted DsbA family dithiol-disulfide isomerase